MRALAFVGRHATRFMAAGVLVGFLVPPLAAAASPLLVPALLIPLSLALLRLELEWMGGNHIDAATLTDETTVAYTALLKEQAAELETACAELPFHPRYADLLDPDGLFVVDGPSTVERLTLAIDGLTAALARMAAGQAWREVRTLIQEHRRAMRARREWY